MQEQGQSVPHTPDARTWGFWPTLGFGFLTIILSAAIGLLIATVIFSLVAPSNIRQTPRLSSNGLFIMIFTFAMTIVGIALTAGIIRLKKDTSVAEYLAIRQPGRGKTVGVLLLLGIMLTLTTALAATLLKLPPASQVFLDAYKTSVRPELFGIAIVVFAPAFEEIFFRGFLFAGFSRSRIGIVGTTVLTSLLWTLMHVGSPIYAILTVFALGILLGIARYKSESIWSPLIMHAVNNLIGMIGIVLASSMGSV